MIQMFSVKTEVNSDSRRSLSEIVFLDQFPLMFPVGQVKVITFTDDAVRYRQTVGNHYHTIESGRHEVFVAVGPANVELIRFRYRDGTAGPVKEVMMKNGDACLIPPGHSHAFTPLAPEVALWGLSNIPYDSAHDVKDVL